MVCASNKERVFYVVKGDNDNYIENIDDDFKITTTKNPYRALHMHDKFYFETNEVTVTVVVKM